MVRAPCWPPRCVLNEYLNQKKTTSSSSIPPRRAVSLAPLPLMSAGVPLSSRNRARRASARPTMPAWTMMGTQTTTRTKSKTRRRRRTATLRTTM